MASEETITRLLESQGWKRQFVAAQPRLGEAVQVYRDVGFKVHLETLPPREKPAKGQACPTNGECRACFEGFEDQYKIIFTKPDKNNRNPLEENPF